MLLNEKLTVDIFKDIEKCQCDICGKITNEIESMAECYYTFPSKIQTDNKVSISLSIDSPFAIYDTDNIHICDDCFSTMETALNKSIDKLRKKNKLY